MDNKYERMAGNMSDVAAKLVHLMRRLPFDMKMARGNGGAQLAYDCMALERVSLRLIEQVFLGKRNDLRPWLGPQEDPCIRAIRSLQCVFTNIARLDQAVSYWPDSDSLSEDIATLLRIAATLLEEDLALMLDALKAQVKERFAAWHQERPRSTGEDGSETLASDGSLGILAGSAEEQAASLEAMLHIEYTSEAETTPPPKPLRLIVVASMRHRPSLYTSHGELAQRSHTRVIGGDHQAGVGPSAQPGRQYSGPWTSNEISTVVPLWRCIAT